MPQRVELDLRKRVDPYRFNPIAAQPIGRVGGAVGQWEHKFKTAKLVSETVLILMDTMLSQRANNAWRQADRANSGPCFWRLEP